MTRACTPSGASSRTAKSRPWSAMGSASSPHVTVPCGRHRSIKATTTLPDPLPHAMPRPDIPAGAFVCPGEATEKPLTLTGTRVHTSHMTTTQNLSAIHRRLLSAVRRHDGQDVDTINAGAPWSRGALDPSWWDRRDVPAGAWEG